MLLCRRCVGSFHELTNAARYLPRVVLRVVLVRNTDVVIASCFDKLNTVFDELLILIPNRHLSLFPAD